MTDFERKQRASPGQQRIPILDLRRKLEYIPSLFNEPQTLSALSFLAGIPRSTLGEANDGMTIPTLKKLQSGLNAKGLRFSIQWLEWRDPSEQGRDTFAAFCTKLTDENANFVPPLHKQNGIDATQIGEVTLEVDRTAQMRRETHPLASLVLFTLQPGPGEPWPISFELCCNPDEDEFDNVAVKRGKLTIDPGGAELDAESRPGFKQPLIHDGSRGPVCFTWNGRKDNDYVWKVDTEGDYIGNVGTPVDDGFVRISGLKPGTSITARFEIVLKDLTHRPEESVPADSERLPIVRLGVDGLGEAKEWIVRRIKELALSDDNGRVLLAEHVVPFKARHSSKSENDPQ